MSEWLAKARAKINEFATYKENWDGYGAVALTPEGAALAWALCEEAHAQGAEGWVVPTVNGGLAIAWEPQGWHAEAIVEQDAAGRYEVRAYASETDSDWYDGWERPPTPENVKAAVRQVGAFVRDGRAGWEREATK